MKFPGCWVSEKNGTVFVVPDVFDETDLSEKSNWTETHQNEDHSFPAGYVDPARLLFAVGLKLLEANPDLSKAVTEFNVKEMKIRTAHDFGLFCLSLSESLASQARSVAHPITLTSINQERLDYIPFN